MTDLCAISACIQPMGSLQPGLPNPSMIPQDWLLMVIDLKDCFFFSIPLDQKDCERFAFSVPVFNNSQPLSRYQWKVLPQGMLNSPTLCQKFVHRALDPVKKCHPFVLLYHYMDDILLATPTEKEQQDAFTSLQMQLSLYSLNIAPEKIQMDFPIQYLGYTLGAQNI